MEISKEEKKQTEVPCKGENKASMMRKKINKEKVKVIEANTLKNFT
jgi:hypothetical protein